MKKLRLHNLSSTQIPPLFSRTTTLTREHVDFLLQPCVYRFLKEGEALYIGVSKNGIIRVLCKNHHAKEARKLADEIAIEWYPTEQAAKIAERREISIHKPPYNVFGVGINTMRGIKNLATPKAPGRANRQSVVV